MYKTVRGLLPYAVLAVAKDGYLKINSKDQLNHCS